MAILEQGHFDATCYRNRGIGAASGDPDLDQQILPRKLEDRNFYSRFRGLLKPQLKVLAAGTLNATGGGAATGAAGDENYLTIIDGKGAQTLEYHILGTQTILFPQRHADGLDIGMDQTDNDGVELCGGIESGSYCAYTVGTDGAVFIRLKFSVADVSGTDDLAIGFRKREAYQANVDDYDEMAALNVISGDIKIETILNAAATVTTDTTDNWADAATHTLEVRVSAAGVVTYLIDGAAPTTTAAFTFDNGEVIVPFLFFLNATDLAGEVVLKDLEFGFQV